MLSQPYLSSRNITFCMRNHHDCTQATNFRLGLVDDDFEFLQCLSLASNAGQLLRGSRYKWPGMPIRLNERCPPGKAPLISFIAIVLGFRFSAVLNKMSHARGINARAGPVSGITTHEPRRESVHNACGVHSRPVPDPRMLMHWPA
jgi:hypothetical protein